MRIEILNSEREALERIEQLRAQGFPADQLSVIHDPYKEVPAVEELTEVETIEAVDPAREESIFDRFVDWVSGRDRLDHLFEHFDVEEEDQALFRNAILDGNILLAIEEDEAIARTHFRYAHGSESVDSEERERTADAVIAVEPTIALPREEDRLRIDEPNYLTDPSLQEADPVDPSEPEIPDERGNPQKGNYHKPSFEVIKEYQPAKRFDGEAPKSGEHAEYRRPDEERLRIDEPNYMDDETL